MGCLGTLAAGKLAGETFNPGGEKETKTNAGYTVLDERLHMAALGIQEIRQGPVIGHVSMAQSFNS